MDITTTTAISGGTVTGSAITARGVCWSTSATPSIADNKTTDGTGAGNFLSNITGLTEGTRYYVRAYATNSSGTGYGGTLSFSTQLTDIDGNIYNTVIIGTQIWTVENLKVTQYNDGTAIPLVTEDIAWANLTTPGYCWYNNDAPTNKDSYGGLYNWYAVNTGKLCPSGWHVPTDAEWTTLINYLGGEDVAGGKLKETGTAHWLEPNAEATNESGFTGLPGGKRWSYESNTYYSYNGNQGTWWSSSELDSYFAWHCYMNSNDARVLRELFNKQNARSVRCLKD